VPVGAPTTKRVMVLLHGTGGTAYDELAGELDMARRDEYSIVAIQWLDKDTGRYAPTLKINRIRGGVSGPHNQSASRFGHRAFRRQSPTDIKASGEAAAAERAGCRVRGRVG
jgi:hypothetical protein